MGIPGSAHPAFGFGAVTIAGGVLGFIRKGSKPSLIAGKSALVCFRIYDFLVLFILTNFQVSHVVVY